MSNSSFPNNALKHESIFLYYLDNENICYTVIILTFAPFRHIWLTLTGEW